MIPLGLIQDKMLVSKGQVLRLIIIKDMDLTYPKAFTTTTMDKT